jgi:alpha-galactosidase
MGWNSWDCFGTSVTEDEVKANADAMAKRLKQHGWQYIVVDIQWSEPNAKAHGYRPNAELTMDQYGRLTPAVNRFPSAMDGRGFKPLAGYVHDLGLKFGLHIMRGIPRRAVAANLPVFGSKARAADIANPNSVCPWNTDMYGVDMSRAGAQDYYDSIVRMYADWGVDYIKADDIVRPIYREEIVALRKAIQKTGRPIVVSVSPGPARVEDAAFLAEYVQLWRVSDDFWDEWKYLRENLTLLSLWGGLARPGAWPDGDMLPLGRLGIRAERGDPRMTRFTRDEQRTMMSLWSMAQSPLMLGGNLPDNDEFTNALITNDEVLQVNQKGSHARAFSSSGNQIVWVSDAPDGISKYLGVFNVGDRAPESIRLNWAPIGLASVCVVRDLWAHHDIGKLTDGNAFQIPPHGSGLFKLTPSK